jgi:tetratricopeptide (TPR) repeat protein
MFSGAGTKTFGVAALLAFACMAHAADYDSSHAHPGALFGSALIAADRGRVTDALARIDKQIASDPHNGNLHYQRALTLMRQDLPVAAQDEFRVVERMRPDDASVHVALGWAWLVQGQTDQSIAEFIAAVKMRRPMNAAVTYAMLSLALETKHDNDDAITTLSSALRASSPEYAWDFLAVRCNIAAQIGLLDAAAEACDATIEQHPRNAYAFEGRGLLDLRNKQWPRAIADYTKVLYLDPDDAFALYGRSLAKRASGDSGALADRQAALTQEPTIADIFARSYGLK